MRKNIVKIRIGRKKYGGLERRGRGEKERDRKEKTGEFKVFLKPKDSEQREKDMDE